MVKEFAPWMVEESFKYYLASCHLGATKGLEYVSCVNAALSIEILFKSYLCKKEVNKHGVAIFKFDSSLINKDFKDEKRSCSHDLYTLARSLPIDIQSYLFLDSDFEILKRHRHTFTDSRYLYEVSLHPGYSDILSELAGLYVNKTINLYKKSGCDDLFISKFEIKY
ncbi:hypothetical protein [Photobacterium leiognathi]|uniref:hypothetical protein n=1 Tax=Photobacterium leiognathi TaxID=553611 RepID=UPI00076A976F|nr:hypothetical protein [Photobacterium leiognathi]